VVVLFIVTAVSIAFLFAAAANATGTPSERGMLKLMFAATATEMMFVACCTVAVMFHVSRLARSIVHSGRGPTNG
jgi:hypothetical protein